MIGLDTNVLARYYIDDATDEEAARQREAAQRLIESGNALHHAGYRRCDAMATFDDRRFARRARRLGLLPPVTVCH
jgi:hypothetical protein